MNDKTAQNTTTEEPEKLDLRSHVIAEDKQADLLRLFPEIRTEDGKVDFDKLKLVLGETVDVGRERYGMNWPGKADCFKTIQQPSLGTLLPRRDESVNFDTTENLIIEGDNLEVLKLLQKSYLGKVKMIYIDPPYNTGNEFIYPDNYSESLHTYLEYTGQVDSEGRKFSTNSETDGRFHSKWLNMMYPRLYLARNLLSEDGTLFISIDDHEYPNLKMLCDQVFGEENFVANIIWQKVFSPKNTAQYFSDDHEYVLLYAKSKDRWRPELLARSEESIARYLNPDNDSRGPWMSGAVQARNYYSKGQYEVTSPSGKTFRNPKGTYWRFSAERFAALDKDNRIWWGEDGGNVPRLKRFLSEVKKGVVPQTLWLYTDVGHTQEAKEELLKFVEFENTENVLNSVKPSRLVMKMLQVGTQSESADIVLDFFCGSGTTAHAVMKQNDLDGGNRRFILVQLPEPLPQPEERVKTIADLAKSRIRKVAESLAKSHEGQMDFEQSAPADLGMRVLSLAESNIKPWGSSLDDRSADQLTEQLQLHIEHIRGGRSMEDLLYEILLKSGFSLTTPIELLDVEGKSVYSIADGAMLICLERNLTYELLNAMATRIPKPERVVCLDAGFAGNDQLKTNAVQTMKARGVTSFRTV